MEVAAFSRVTDIDALEATASLAHAWTPFPRHRNVQRLVRETDEFMRRLAALRDLEVDIKFVPKPQPPPGHPRVVDEESQPYRILRLTRSWMDGIARVDRVILPELARFNGLKARQYVQVRDDALDRVRNLRATFAIGVNETDDLDLGFRLIPDPPPIGKPAAPIVVPPFLPTAKHSYPSEQMDGATVLRPGGVELLFTAAAAAQVKAMQAAAEQNPRGAYRQIWRAAEWALTRLCDANAVFSPEFTFVEDISAQFCRIPRSRFGRARFFYLPSPKQKRILVLLIAEWTEGTADAAIEALTERLRSSEWDTALNQFGSFIRPTERGRGAMLRAIDLALAEREIDQQSADLLRSRLESAGPYDPVLVEDVADSFRRVSVIAEDVVDLEDITNEDAGEMMPWDQAKAELDL